MNMIDWSKETFPQKLYPDVAYVRSPWHRYSGIRVAVPKGMHLYEKDIVEIETQNGRAKGRVVNVRSVSSKGEDLIQGVVIKSFEQDTKAAKMNKSDKAFWKKNLEESGYAKEERKDTAKYWAGVIVFFAILAFLFWNAAGGPSKLVDNIQNPKTEKEKYYAEMSREDRHWAEVDVEEKLYGIEERQDEIETALDDLYNELGESDEKFEASAVRETMWEEYQELEEERKALEQELEEIKNASK